MVGFDDGGFSAQATLHYIRVDGALCQEVHGSDFLGLFLEDTDEFLSDDFPLVLRLGDTGKFLIIALLCVDTDKVQIKLAVGTKYCLNLISLVLAEKAVIHENTGELLSDGAGEKSCRHG